MSVAQYQQVGSSSQAGGQRNGYIEVIVIDIVYERQVRSLFWG